MRTFERIPHALLLACLAVAVAVAASACDDSGKGAPNPSSDQSAALDMTAGAHADAGTGDQATPADQSSAPDQAALPDQSPAPDLAPPDFVGQACPNGDNDCAPGLFCLNDESTKGLFPKSGYCTQPCTKDADCGGGNFCSIPLGTSRICFARCGVGGKCPTGQLCGQHLNGALDVGNPACLPGNAKAVDGSACKTFADCNKGQTCLNNPFDTPGGLCVTVGCTPGDDTTCVQGGSGTCLPVAPSVNICVAACAKDADCRTADGYVCVGDQVKVCNVPHAVAGAACAKDADCGKSPWRCVTGSKFPGGSCGAALGTCTPGADETCPFDTRCFDPMPTKPKNGLYSCAHVCAADADCRQAAGYKCLPLDATGKMATPKVCRVP